VLASGLIDAHAGAMALLGCELKSTWLPASIPLTKRLALICGTSACHMALTKDPVFVKGVWGPYQSALVPGLWLLEGGQSATGSLIDHVVETHPCYQLALQQAVEQGLHVHGYLNTVLQAEASKRGLACVALLTKQLHVQPDFHGNRSPRADATLRGAVQGLRLGDNSVDALAVLYLACVQALAYGTRHIIEEMAAKGVHFDCVMACGGLTKNPLFLQQHANITKLPFVLAESQETVSLGAAIAARAAADSVSSSDRAQDRAEAEAAAEDQAVTNCDTSVKQGGGESGALLVSAMRRMGRAGRVVMPYFEDSRDVSVDGSVAEEETSFHSKKYRVFHAMHEHHMECRRIMQGT
jgi:FGGY-family pentulose kinase